MRDDHHVYAYGMRPADVRLTAGDGIILHDFLRLAGSWRTVDITVPREATREGFLKLEWTNRGGGNTGCVCEILLRKVAGQDAGRPVMGPPASRIGTDGDSPG